MTKEQNPLHFEVLDLPQKELFGKFRENKIFESFYLAGGTGLALQIGHRISEDFDFFTEADIDKNNLLYSLQKDYKFELLAESRNTLHGTINGVRLSFLSYKYKTISEFVSGNGIKIAGISDIACMKLSAISQRSTKKDFIDLYFILKNQPLKEIYEKYNLKYGISEYEYVLKKSLTYFIEAEEDPMPKMLTGTNWEEVKKTIENAVYSS